MGVGSVSWYDYPGIGASEDDCSAFKDLLWYNQEYNVVAEHPLPIAILIVVDTRVRIGLPRCPHAID